MIAIAFKHLFVFTFDSYDIECLYNTRKHGLLTTYTSLLTHISFQAGDTSYIALCWKNCKLLINVDNLL